MIIKERFPIVSNPHLHLRAREQEIYMSHVCIKSFVALNNRSLNLKYRNLNSVSRMIIDLCRVTL